MLLSSVDSKNDVVSMKKRIANCLRIMVNEGLFELTYGHMSCRIPGTDQFLVLGHLHDKGKSLFDVTYEDIVTMNADGETLPGEIEAPGERFIHTEIYKRRKDVQAIVHCHPFYSTVFSIANTPVFPVNHLGIIFAPETPIHQYTGQIDNVSKADDLAHDLGDKMAVLIRSHGVTVVGHSIEMAAIHTLALETTAKMQYTASQIGIPRAIPVEYRTGMFTEGLDSKEYYETAWDYYTRKHSEKLETV
jgi:ribulose-5-phosphate 4-epimerase/fuculose-1-phosphate aldolase